MSRKATFSAIFSILLTLPCGSAALGKVPDSWHDLPPLPTPRQEVGVAALEGKVYVLGGILADQSATGIVERFDTEAMAWESVAPLPEGAQLHHVGAAATDGKVYAAGGLNAGFRGVRSVFAFSPLTESWERVADLPWPRGAMGVAGDEGLLYSAGGQDGSQSFRGFAVYLDLPLSGRPAAPRAGPVHAGD